MYTSIDTNHVLEVIANFLRHHNLADGLLAEPIIAGLKLIMRWNIFRFGDTFWRQFSGTAMGTLTACVYATLYFAIHKLAKPDVLQACLAIYKQYIDDGTGIWTGSTAQWHHDFKEWINSFGTLQWTFTKLCRGGNYLDITIRLDSTMSIWTNLYEKPLNLYLYLPPHSAHLLLGVLTGLVYGMICRVYCLTLDFANYQAYLCKFSTCLCYCGYLQHTLVLL